MYVYIVLVCFQALLILLQYTGIAKIIIFDTCNNRSKYISEYNKNGFILLLYSNIVPVHIIYVCIYNFSMLPGPLNTLAIYGHCKNNYF